jgi:hypothetical protein
MENEFIPYEQALALKELGFDEPCFGYYDEGGNLYTEMVEVLKAPLYQQAFRWFREKYGLNYVVVKAESWFYTINGCSTQEGFQTYEEAELACLEKLIELVEQKEK